LIDLLTLFANNLLPVFLIAGAGYLVGHYIQMDPRTISQVVFYIFAPCLLFNLLTTSELSSEEIAKVMLIALVTTLILGALAWFLGLILRIPRTLLAGVLLTSMFMNAGNFGLPIVLFAFGNTALSYATLYFVTISILNYSLGAIIASMGKESLLKSIGNLLRVPMVYSLILALIVMATGWEVPAPLARPVKLLGDASIPSMLVLLGLQLRSAKWDAHPAPITLASAVRLVAAPLITLAIVPLFGLNGPARQAIILESAMPAAVSNILMATEFNADPPFVSAIVIISTLLAPLTLTPLLAYLGA
jgi:predicted permease